MGGDWDPERYGHFGQERREPFEALLAMVEPRQGMAVLDLGCGTGELTRALHDRLDARMTLGVDNSEAMLANSQGFVGQGLTFHQADIRQLAFGASSFDLIFSNSVLQWVPDNHAVLTSAARWLRPGGQLAVQVPCNDDHPSHATAARLAGEEPFRSALGGWVRRSHVLELAEYAARLHELGFEALSCREQVFNIFLPSRLELLDWVRGSLLTPYRARLGEELYQQFLWRYRELLIDALPDWEPFYYPFRRRLIYGRKPG